MANCVSRQSSIDFIASKQGPFCEPLKGASAFFPNRLPNYENNPRIHRADHDFPVAWSKMYGKGRVFYSTLSHTEEAWEDPDIRKMYFEAIKWSLGMTEGSTASHAKPAVQK
jgi:hypothetical protein